MLALNQRVEVKGFGIGKIIVLPYNKESNTYIVEFDKPQKYRISKRSVPMLYTTIVADEKDLTPIE